jgi:hypothetical protein
MRRSTQGSRRDLFESKGWVQCRLQVYCSVLCCAYLSLRFQPVANFFEQQFVVLHVLEHLNRNHSVILTVKLFLRQVERVYIACRDGDSAAFGQYEDEVTQVALHWRKENHLRCSYRWDNFTGKILQTK